MHYPSLLCGKDSGLEAVANAKEAAEISGKFRDPKLVREALEQITIMASMGFKNVRFVVEDSNQALIARLERNLKKKQFRVTRSPFDKDDVSPRTALDVSWE